MAYYTDVVTPLQWAVLDIQRNGMLIDAVEAKRLHDMALAKQAEIGGWFNDALGYPFNPNAPQQIMRLFNDDFLVPLTDSSDKLAMRKAQIRYPELAPIITGILDYRDLGKKASTYLRPHPHKDGRVRSRLKVYGTLTWRLSSSEPNLQNIPRSPSLGINIKDLYIAPQGFTLVELDKKQLEFRIPAYASGSKKLIEWFESDVDLYCMYASELYGREIKGGSPERQLTKTILLADGYGAAAPRVSDTMLLQTGEWREPKSMQPILDKLRNVSPEKYDWFNECWARAKRERCLYEGFGVPRLLYNAPDDLRQVAYSWPTQATASGVINRALVRIWRYLKEAPGWWQQVRIICQIHDALLFEIPTEAVQEAVPILINLMDQPETIFGKTVILPSEAKCGPRWGSMSKWKG